MEGDDLYAELCKRGVEPSIAAQAVATVRRREEHQQAMKKTHRRDLLLGLLALAAWQGIQLVVIALIILT